LGRAFILAVAAALLLAGCGKNTPTYSLEKTSDCLTGKGVRLGGPLDFVATTATGGAVRAHLPNNALTLVFGLTPDDADNIDAAYRRFHASNVGIDDVLRQQNNAVMLWQAHPADADLALVTGCLK
jgi:hypothetical protein